MKNKSDGKYFAKLDIEEYFQFGPFDTREQAIIEAQKEWTVKDSNSGEFETGKLDGYIPTIDWTTDNLSEQASEQGGCESDYPNITSEQQNKLDEYLTDCLHKWLIENKVDAPNFGLITDTEKHQLKNTGQ